MPRSGSAVATIAVNRERARPRRLTASAAAASTVLALVTVTTGQSATASTPLMAQREGSAGPAETSRLVTLVTGDRVRVVSDGSHTSATVRRRAETGLGSAMSALRLGDRSYVIPAVARPYLGRYLDPRCSTCSTWLPPWVGCVST